MSWAARAIEELQRGEVAVIYPKGNSMLPLVLSGQRVEVEPCVISDLAVGDIVLCRVGGNDYLHLVKAASNGRVLIGNNRGGTNGWTKSVFGRMKR